MSDARTLIRSALRRLETAPLMPTDAGTHVQYELAAEELAEALQIARGMAMGTALSVTYCYVCRENHDCARPDGPRDQSVCPLEREKASA